MKVTYNTRLNVYEVVSDWGTVLSQHNTRKEANQHKKLMK